MGKEETRLWKLISKDICPDCGPTKFLAGPQGGGCQNIKCENCGSKFNVDPMFHMVDRIGNKEEDKRQENLETTLEPIEIDRIHGETVKYSTNLSRDTLGIHQICRGFVDIRLVSKNWNVLHCRGCGLRKYFPAHIDNNVYDEAKFWERIKYYFEIQKS